MTSHALLVALLACLAKPAPQAMECINANPELRARAEMLVALAEDVPTTKPRCLQHRSCGRR